jgi:DNA-binding response OmpR family regulator
MSVGGEPVRRSALEAGADFFVHKPVVVGDLLATLERLGRARGSS